MKPKILSQGILDGACLLYSIMNAYKSLSPDYQEESAEHFMESGDCKEKWDTIVSTVPSAFGYFRGKGSNGLGFDSSDERYFTHRTVKDSFHLLGAGKKKYTVFENIKLSDIVKTNFSNSVIILCCKNYDKKEDTYGVHSIQYDKRIISDHWICVVGKKDNSLLIQCSLVIHTEKKYEEIEAPYKRVYNDSFDLKQIKRNRIYERLIYKISKK
jgi:hypothetical protein